MSRRKKPSRAQRRRQAEARREQLAVAVATARLKIAWGDVALMDVMFPEWRMDGQAQLCVDAILEALSERPAA